MAARHTAHLPDPARPFTDLLSQYLLRIVGTGVATAGLALTTGCVQQDFCVDVADADSCSALGAADLDVTEQCIDGTRHVASSIVGSPEFDDGVCCGEARWDARANGTCTNPPGVVDGRPLVIDGAARTARLGGSSSWVVESPIPQAETLSDAARAYLVDRWTTAGLYEHASVASFAKFSLDLMALGAPPDLLAGAQRAASDEIRHARLCFGLASAFAEEDVTPGPLEFPGGGVALEADLEAFARATVREGCIGEALAAVVAAERYAVCRDQSTSAVLSSLIEDEARHAALAWRTIAWAVSEGGAPIRDAVRDELSRAGDIVDGFGSEMPPVGQDLRGYGVLSPVQERTALRAAIASVILPAADALLG